MRLVRLAALALLLLPVQAWAFDWFGLRSGMTLDQVRSAAPAGASLRLNGDFGFIEKGGEAVATVTFCKGRLIALSRTIDAQSDWFALADRLIKQYGAPKVTPTSDPWAKANVSKGLELSWRSGRNKYALTAFPPAQPAQGQGQGQGQGSGKTLAMLSVADLGPVNACVPKHAAARAQTRKASAVRRVTRVTRVSRVKRGKPRLPPIGGAKLDQALQGAQPGKAQAGKAQPAEAQAAKAQAARAPRLRSAAPADSAADEDSEPQADPNSIRGRILRFFGALKTRPGDHGIEEDR